jgi:hypothetical protein
VSELNVSLFFPVYTAHRIDPVTLRMSSHANIHIFFASSTMKTIEANQHYHWPPWTDTVGETSR